VFTRQSKNRIKAENLKTSFCVTQCPLLACTLRTRKPNCWFPKVTLRKPGSGRSTGPIRHCNCAGLYAVDIQMIVVKAIRRVVNCYLILIISSLLFSLSAPTSASLTLHLCVKRSQQRSSVRHCVRSPN